MVARAALLLLAATVLPAAAAPAADGVAAGPGCMQRLQALEAQEKIEIHRLVGQIGLAADDGNAEAVCAAGADLLATYERLQKAAAPCSGERAAFWASAERASFAALSGPCR